MEHEPRSYEPLEPNQDRCNRWIDRRRIGPACSEDVGALTFQGPPKNKTDLIPTRAPIGPNRGGVTIELPRCINIEKGQ